ncbi:MAG: hypothetical protein QMD00_03485, partial [Hadesarchaea archaeon]|nr:hypothetical protein [Hadesarchaea archaeon]
MSWTAESRKVLGSLIVLGMVLSTFTAAVSVVATSLPPKLIPNISLAPVENLVGYWSFDEGEGGIADDGSGVGTR